MWCIGFVQVYWCMGVVEVMGLCMGVVDVMVCMGVVEANIHRFIKMAPKVATVAPLLHQDGGCQDDDLPLLT
jgi:hypothetical protein